MNYLKSIFPITNTLPSHLRRFTALTEDEIRESTKLFDYAIVVCDMDKPCSPFNGPSYPCQFKFKELLEFAKEKRARRGHLFIEDSINIGPWYRFHKIVGDAILRYFFEKCHLFRALSNVDSPSSVVQITGTPVFSNASALRNGNKTKKVRKKKKSDGRIIEDHVGEVVVDNQEPQKRKKTCRRGKRKKRKTVVSEISSGIIQPDQTVSKEDQLSRKLTLDSRQLAASALRVPIKRLLYSGDTRERFVGKHGIADVAKKRDDQIYFKSFLELTFGFSIDDPPSADVSLSVSKFVPIANGWIKRHRRLKCYSPYLDKFCPIENIENAQFSELVQNVCPIIGVKFALERIFSRLIASELFGNLFNTNRVISAIIDFVVNARRYDVTSLHQLASCVKTSKCRWLCIIEDNTMRQHFLLRVINLLIRYVYRVVACCFYITDSQSDKYRLFFYRKPVWHRITRMASDQFSQRCQLIATNYIQSSYYGPFALRWIPKSDGDVRPIICGQHGKRRAIPGVIGNSVTAMNNDLKPMLAIAQYLVRQKPGVLGHSTGDFNDIHRIWKSYIAQTRLHNIPRHYMVKADISGCFDCIDQKLLWRLVEENLLADAPDRFSLQGHWLIRSSTALGGFTNRKLRFAVRPFERPQSLARYYARLNSGGKGNTLVVPKGQPIVISKRDFADRLDRLIFRRVIALSGKRGKYLQTLGISQGSSLSVLLCNLYLAGLEKMHLDPIVDEGDLLMRHIDDLIYISPCPKRAQRFAEIVTRGFDDFNCYFKVEKTVSNFEWDIALSNDLAVIAPNPTNMKPIIPWCGLLFDSRSLDVYIDHKRWFGKDTRDFIVTDFSKYPPSYIVQKLLYYLRTRASIIPFDTGINSIKCVKRNLCHLTKFLAFCFGAYVKAYGNSRMVDENAKRRIRDGKFVEELAKRIHDTVCKRVGKKSKKMMRLGWVMKMLLAQVGE